MKNAVARPAEKKARRGIGRIAWVVWLAGLFAFYYWTAVSSTGRNYSDDEDSTLETGHYYHLLTKGFLAGHLYLPVAPAPQMMALRDPYDATQNASWRLHDASLYDGKYYLYFGATPVVTLFLPWKVITGHAIPQYSATVIFLLGGHVFSCLLLFLLARAARIVVSPWLKCAAVMALGLGQVAPIVARRGTGVYEVAVSAGFCFFLAGMYFLARRIAVEGESSPKWSVAAGVCLGLAAGCRPHYGLVAALLLAGYAMCWFRREGFRREVLKLGVPVVLCGLLLAWYNFARFGNPVEFGTKYELTGSAISRVALNARNIVPCLYFFLFSMPQRIDQFPFLQLVKQARTPWGHAEWMPLIDFGGNFAGMLVVTPLSLAGFLLPVLLWKKSTGLSAGIRLIVVALWGAAITMLVGACWTGSVSMRYHVDFAPELLVVGLFVSWWRLARTRQRWGRRAITALTAGACVWGVAAGMALSINGYQEGLRTNNPEAFWALADFFGADPEAHQSLNSLKMNAKVWFAPGATGREALLTSGGRNGGDFVFVEYVGEGRVKLGYAHSRGRTVLSREAVVTVGREYRIEIAYEHTYGDETAVTVRVDGQTVLELTTTLYDTNWKYISVGRDGLRAAGLKPFSGRMEVGNGPAVGLGG